MSPYWEKKICLVPLICGEVTLVKFRYFQTGVIGWKKCRYTKLHGNILDGFLSLNAFLQWAVMNNNWINLNSASDAWEKLQIPRASRNTSDSILTQQSLGGEIPIVVWAASHLLEMKCSWDTFSVNSVHSEYSTNITDKKNTLMCIRGQSCFWLPPCVSQG